MFYELNVGASLETGKNTRVGLRPCIELLERAFERNVLELVEEHRSPDVARDDIVDAIAGCWTAGARDEEV